MAHTYQKIDIEMWERKEHCQIYMNAPQPQYCVSFELDITNFKLCTKKKNWPFTMAFIFVVTKHANEIKEFRYRFIDDNIVLYETIDTYFTYLNKKTELFKMVNVPMQETIDEFIQLARNTAESQQEYFTGYPQNNVYIFSALPWITFTHISHTDFGNKRKAQPLFDWGKYYEKDGKLMMPFSVQVHHSFVDGIHIGKLANNLQQYLNQF